VTNSDIVSRIRIGVGWLPSICNSESMHVMKSHKACRCLLVASVLMTLSSGVAAQEVEQPQQASPEQALPRLFVSDRLVLNVHSEPDQGGTRVATIETGDVVEEIGRSGNFVQVRLTDGREGWVGANYLTTDAPAATRLRERQDATSAAEKRSAAEVTRLKKEAAALQAQVDQMKAAAAPVPAAAATIASVESAVAQTPSSSSKSLPATTASTHAWPTWLWPVAIVLCVGAGFAAGYQTLARRIHRRFGGLRLY
jgi:SH3 domain protein